jgi:hypothetical protein
LREGPARNLDDFAVELVTIIERVTLRTAKHFIRLLPLTPSTCPHSTMTAPDIESSSAPVTPLTLDNIDDLSESVRKIVVESEDDEDTSKPTDAPRPFYIYTRAQALRLSKSPLVQCPQGMPDFKEWFG